MKMIGIGMLVALLIDATIVRALLVPATMQLLGPLELVGARPAAALVGAARLPRGRAAGCRARTGQDSGHRLTETSAAIIAPAWAGIVAVPSSTRTPVPVSNSSSPGSSRSIVTVGVAEVHRDQQVAAPHREHAGVLVDRARRRSRTPGRSARAASGAARPAAGRRRAVRACRPVAELRPVELRALERRGVLRVGHDRRGSQPIRANSAIRPSAVASAELRLRVRGEELATASTPPTPRP